LDSLPILLSSGTLPPRAAYQLGFFADFGIFGNCVPLVASVILSEREGA
jgi:hypothetical protein